MGLVLRILGAQADGSTCCVPAPSRANAPIAASVCGELLSRARERYVLPFLAKRFCFPRLYCKNLTDLWFEAWQRVRGVAEGLLRETGFGETSLGL